jgi:PAS domain S-box-containing protein
MGAKDIAATEPRLDFRPRGPGLGTWWWDITNNMLAWDEAIRSLFGVPPNTTVDNYEAFLAYVHRDDRASVHALVERAVTAAEDYEATFRVVLSDGEIRIIAARGVVYHDAHGNPARMIGVCWDTTAQRRADEALRTSEARYRGIIDSTAALIARADPEGRFTFVNPTYCQTVGKVADELIGKPFLDVVHEDDLARIRQVSEQTVASQHQTHQFDCRLRTPTGSAWIAWDGCAIVNEHGVITELQAVGFDITERLAIEQTLRISLGELRRSEESLRRLAQRQASIREEERKRLSFDLHDNVCQELVGVAIMLESLQRRLGSLPAAEAAEFDRIVAYLKELLEHLRVLAHDLRPMLLRDVGLEAALRTLAVGTSSTTTRVTAVFSTVTPRIGDEIELGVYRIAQEALANALRHAGARTIVLTLSAADHRLCLELRDDGCGFTPPDHEGSEALGLLGMKERALAIGATLGVRSELGKGTVVTLECPFTAVAPTTSA